MKFTDSVKYCYSAELAIITVLCENVALFIAFLFIIILSFSGSSAFSKSDSLYKIFLFMYYVNYPQLFVGIDLVSIFE